MIVCLFVGRFVVKLDWPTILPPSPPRLPLPPLTSPTRPSGRGSEVLGSTMRSSRPSTREGKPHPTSLHETCFSIWFWAVLAAASSCPTCSPPTPEGGSGVVSDESLTCVGLRVAECVALCCVILGGLVVLCDVGGLGCVVLCCVDASRASRPTAPTVIQVNAIVPPNI